MYICNNCEHEFDNPIVKNTTYESFYGVAGMFPNSTPMELYLCPWCGSDDFELNDEETESDL